MSNSATTTHAWSCDFCGKPTGDTPSQYQLPEGMRQFKLRGERGTTDFRAHPHGETFTVDICTGCMQRPITELAERFDQWRESKPTPVVVQRVAAS